MSKVTQNPSWHKGQKLRILLPRPTFWSTLLPTYPLLSPLLSPQPGFWLTKFLFNTWLLFDSVGLARSGVGSSKWTRAQLRQVLQSPWPGQRRTSRSPSAFPRDMPSWLERKSCSTWGSAGTRREEGAGRRKLGTFPAYDLGQVTSLQALDSLPIKWWVALEWSLSQFRWFLKFQLVCMYIKQHNSVSYI